MSVPATEYTGESIAAVIAMPLVIVGLAVAGWLLIRKARTVRDDFDRPMLLGLGIAGAAGAVLAVVGFWWGMYPWKAEYHEWRPVSGVVASVDSRLVPAGSNSMEDKFVVTFEGNPQQYGVLDTRAAGVKPGDTLTITCVRRWQWSGTHGFDCNFVDLQR